MEASWKRKPTCRVRLGQKKTDVIYFSNLQVEGRKGSLSGFRGGGVSGQRGRGRVEQDDYGREGGKRSHPTAA